jgi:hypothetical protein
MDALYPPPSYYAALSSLDGLQHFNEHEALKALVVSEAGRQKYFGSDRLAGLRLVGSFFLRDSSLMSPRRKRVEPGL